MKFKKVQLKSKRINLGKLSRRLAENSFLTFFCLLLVSLILGGLIYYKYVILIKSSSISTQVKPPENQEETYQKILEEWAKRGEKFFQADTKEYLYLFKSSTSTPPE